MRLTSNEMRKPRHKREDGINTAEALGMFISNKTDRGASKRTIEFYQGNLGHFARSFPLLPKAASMLQGYIGTIPWTQETRHGYFRSLRAFYNYLEKNNLIKTNPMRLVDAPILKRKLMPTLEADEIAHVFGMLKYCSLRDRAFVTLLLDTGLRASEATSLTEWNISHDHVLVDGKTGERKVPISRETSKLLVQLVNSQSQDTYVFRGQHGRATRSYAYRVVRQLLEAAGIANNKLGPHRLRHTFGRHFLVNGGDISALQVIMGHSNIETTRLYCSLTDNEVTEKHRQFSPLAKLYRRQ